MQTQKHCSGLPPEALTAQRERIDAIVSFWNEVRINDDSGSTSWEVLEDLERQVTECLSNVLADIDRAERLTSRAMLSMTGQLGG